MRKLIKKIVGADRLTAYLKDEFERTKILASKSLINDIKKINTQVPFKDVEFSAFSQWGDDGIIQYLINILNITNRTFIEFGVSNYLESNTRFLLLHDNWKGLIIDGSRENINYIKEDSVSWRFSLTSVCAFITKENINQLIRDNGFFGEIGILHIDIDGNDYWIWEHIDVVNPEIVIMEYNSVFGNKYPISVLYKPDFVVTREHFSNLFFGASLKAMHHLAMKKGYSLVGSNSHGNNAYFVRNDKLGVLNPISPDDIFVLCNFRQNRDSQGSLTLIDDTEMVKKHDYPKVVNVETGEIAPLQNFL